MAVMVKLFRMMSRFRIKIGMVTVLILVGCGVTEQNNGWLMPDEEKFEELKGDPPSDPATVEIVSYECTVVEEENVILVAGQLRNLRDESWLFTYNHVIYGPDGEELSRSNGHLDKVYTLPGEISEIKMFWYPLDLFEDFSRCEIEVRDSVLNAYKQDN